MLRTTYKDNRFLDAEYTALLESYKVTDPYYYNVYCLGEWGVYGKTIFDKYRVTERITQLRDKKPIEYRILQIHLHREYRTTDIKWFRRPEGYIKDIRERQAKMPLYVISGDTAGEGSDYFASTGFG